MRVFSVFASVDGEVNGFHQGRITTFIRFAGCNFHKDPCTYCDTGYALSPESGKEWSVDEVIDEVQAIGIKNITITGGEPLMQMKEFHSLTSKLCRLNYRISVETNGSLPCLGYGVGSWVVDYKLPSSGCLGEMHTNVFLDLGPADFVKFVVKDETDMIAALKFKEWLQGRGIKANFAFSPWHGELSPNDLIKWLMKEKVYDAILNVQLHKILSLDEKK